MSENLEKLMELAKNLPEAVRSNAVQLVERMGEEIEGIGDQPIKWRPENLRVLQPTSDRSKAPKGANIGSIIIGDLLVKQPFEVIPLRAWDSRQMWSPDKDENKVLCSSPDAVLGYIGKRCKECEFGKFDEEAKRSACNKAKTVLCISADLSTVFVVNFTKTNYANGKDWTTLMRKAGVATYKRIYKLAAETSKKYKNVEALTASTENKSTDEAYLEFLKALFDKVGEDREEHRKKFYEIVEAKQQNAGLLEDHSGGDNVEVLPAPETETTTSQQTMTKKYEL